MSLVPSIGLSQIKCAFSSSHSINALTPLQCGKVARFFHPSEFRYTEPAGWRLPRYSFMTPFHLSEEWCVPSVCHPRLNGGHGLSFKSKEDDRQSHKIQQTWGASMAFPSRPSHYSLPLPPSLPPLWGILIWRPQWMGREVPKGRQNKRGCVNSVQDTWSGSKNPKILRMSDK